MEAWIGPAIVAAIISGLISLTVVQLNFRQERKREGLRRAEKIRDFQIALRAEIRSELRNLSRYNIEMQLQNVRSRYENDPKYAVSVPRPAKQPVFDALVGEIHILPEAVIDPVVLYARQRHAMESLVEDMKDAAFRSLSKEQQIAMYEDYLRMWETWRDFAAQAESALNEGGASVAGTGAGLARDRLGGG